MNYEDRIEKMNKTHKLNYKDRIEKMKQNGTLTQEQAETMEKTVSEIQRESVPFETEHKPLPSGKIVLGTVSVLIIAMIITGLSGGGSEQVATIQDVSETFNQIGKVGEMQKSTQSTLFLTAVFGVPVLLLVLGTMALYNSLVAKEEDVLGSWAQVESNLQRRADLIPNLLSTVKGFMEHEKDVLTEVTEDRSGAGALEDVIATLEGLSKDGSALSSLSDNTKQKIADEAFMKNLAAEQAKIGKNMSKLLGVVEGYPDLRSSDQFLELQDQLEGAENRINVTRMLFNDSVREYNASIRKVPNSLVASLGNFQRKAYFEAEEKSEDTVKVDF